MSLKKCISLFVVLVLTLCVLPLTAAAAETPDEVKAMAAQLPDLDTLKAMTQEEQKQVYDQTQAAYDAYHALSAEERASLEGMEETFQELFDYFNTLVMPLEETTPAEEPAEEEEEGIPWAVTALFLALITTYLQNKFIHGRRR